jgi:hypothetical protein
MEENVQKTSESRTYEDGARRFKRFIQKLRSSRTGLVTGTVRCYPVLPPEQEASISARRAFLGSTLEFMQREYFSGPQPKRNQRDSI